jgi:hypothetical protein
LEGGEQGNGKENAADAESDEQPFAPDPIRDGTFNRLQGHHENQAAQRHDGDL